MTTKKTSSTGRITAPFGAVNRQRLISEFLATAAGAPWLHVYRLLLWTDKTTGLAHCYESDKCQPGKPWHQRSLRFHGWLAQTLGSTPRHVGDDIDWLFRRTADDYAKYMVQQYQTLLKRAASQRAPFAGMAFPEPGEDPAIVEIIRSVLGARLSAEPSEDEWRQMTQRIRELIAVENKRKNLVGEGFEDVLAAVTSAFDHSSMLDVRARCLLQTIPGFANTRVGDKPNKVDVAVVNKTTGRRTIVTAKWSIRADREKQFPAEFASYITAKSDNQPFDYVLLTNEFDPARLVRACEQMTSNAPMFTKVVHISPGALRAVYGPSAEPTMLKVLSNVDAGRLVGFDDWLQSLIA
ncbi:hypothetical protein ACS5PK_20755 [Roseateles sp. DB2]|uniref:hypothetical protein n=1 Tax=Roseateles sp. DB2 TaxID=3453717 RepID=UPI003EEE6C2B